MTAISASTSTSSPATSARHNELANAIRFLSIDAVEKSKSGHPGMPMGMADVATVLFSEFLNYDPAHPAWPNRDRFVLSAGHGSMLLYSLLYLTGYPELTLDEIKQFRQWGARTAGHPEYGHAAGIETTTGPLGQGLANAVGMAIAERLAAARYGDKIVDHHTYVIAGDGCLMEGISHEAMGLAGHLKLSKLIVLFDDNKITIDGATDLSTSENVCQRAEAYGWATQAIDGHDPAAIRAALTTAQTSDKPTLIACRTTIGYGAPNKQGTSATHGSPLGAEEAQATRDALGWPYAPFEIPDHILSGWREIAKHRARAYTDWSASYDAAPADLRGEFERVLNKGLPSGWNDALEHFKRQLAEAKPNEATRKSSENTLNILTAAIPEMIGGSADLTGSNNTKTKQLAPVTPPSPPPQAGGDKGGGFSGRYLYYGIREHGMAAVMNGMALHGEFIPYGGTFLVFTDYCRPAIRLSALMKQRVIYVMTHDSIGLGEDGPTHQPIEHLTSLRAIPNLYVYRPADATETAECWALALTHKDAPSVLSLTRQNIPALRTTYTAENLCALGGYVIRDQKPETGNQKMAVTLIATGSEVHIAIETQERLAEKNIPARVVSMPCTELFDRQPASYRHDVLGTSLRVSIEAASTYGWERYTGEGGINIGLSDFGASAPYQEIYQHRGITPEAIVEKIINKLNSKK